jgi:tRNA (cmo5U34)-methyltransferase
VVPVHNGTMDEEAHGGALAPSSWTDAPVVERYLNRIGDLPPRVAGEEVLRSILPAGVRSVLDLGCGDGRLAALVMEECSEVDHVLAVDSSPPMLERARDRFAGHDRVEIRQWDMEDPIVSLGLFDVIVSGCAIHHLADGRKRDLYAEASSQLLPGGTFANLEVVSSATPELHEEFLRLIGRVGDDPEDQLADAELQLSWMREAGMTHVDCLWRWRGFALLVGRADPG